MRPVLSRAQMREFDAHAIEAGKVPGIVLMENAGRGAADVIAHEALGGEPHGKRVVVVCGAGNNGGDGYVIARHLRARGADAVVFSAVDAAALRGDAAVNRDGFAGTGGSIVALATEAGQRAFGEALSHADAIVDALFGTGLSKPVAGDMAKVVAQVNAAEAWTIAVDLPSGIDADTGATLGVSIRADRTVTFGHPKLGLLTPRGALASGALHVVDLGVPALAGPALAPAAEVLEAADVARLLPPRTLDTHKHRAGHVGVFAGSGGKTGAALHGGRSRRAPRRRRARDRIASWEETADAVRLRVTEEMVATLSRGAGLDASLDAALAGRKAIVVGPGFGTDDDARAAVTALLARWKGPALYDADALSLFAARPEAFAVSAVPCVLTPHAGEAARLLGTTSDGIEADRFAAAQTLATRANAVVILKGAYTLIAMPPGADDSRGAFRGAPGAPIAVNVSACPALATAGSGDTLAGVVGAMLCSLPPFDAACAGVFLHAAVAEAWSAEHGDRGLLASEIAERVPDTIASLVRRSSH